MSGREQGQSSQEQAELWSEEVPAQAMAEGTMVEPAGDPDTDSFLQKLLTRAKASGFTSAEAFLLENESFEAMAMEGEIVQYSANQTRGLGFRGLLEGRMGYASTEAFDEDAEEQLVHGALQSARLCEDSDPQFLYSGEEIAPTLALENPALQAVAPEKKLGFLLRLEQEAKAYDPRIDKVSDATVFTGRQTLRIINTQGMDRRYAQDFCGAYLAPVAKEGDSIAMGEEIVFARDFGKLDSQALAATAAGMALERLHATPVPSGGYHIILLNAVMVDLLSVFAEVFSAEQAQQGLSLLKGKVGENIAARCVTLIDDPLLPNGMASRPFDGEGVPSSKHVLIDRGKFLTFLHNLKTAHKDSVRTTGNASRGSYAAPVRVSPTNFYFQPSDLTLEQLIATVQNGILITDISGLHAGANAVSGDFSLLSKGFLLQNGKKIRPVEQITLAGNFFQMLLNIRAMGNDLRFPKGGMGSPSVDVGELSVAGE